MKPRRTAVSLNRELIDWTELRHILVRSETTVLDRRSALQPLLSQNGREQWHMPGNPLQKRRNCIEAVHVSWVQRMHNVLLRLYMNQSYSRLMHHPKFSGDELINVEWPTPLAITHWLVESHFRRKHQGILDTMILWTLHNVQNPSKNERSWLKCIEIIKFLKNSWKKFIPSTLYHMRSHHLDKNALRSKEVRSLPSNWKLNYSTSYGTKSTISMNPGAHAEYRTTAMQQTDHYKE